MSAAVTVAGGSANAAVLWKAATWELGNP